MRKRFIAIAAAALLVTAAASAQRPGRAAREGRGGLRGLANYLQLSDEQIASAKQIHSDTEAAIRPLAEQVQAQRQQIDTALDAATPDPTAIGSLQISMHQTIAQIRATRDSGEAKFVAILTPDQKTKFTQFQEMRRSMRESRRADR